MLSIRTKVLPHLTVRRRLFCHRIASDTLCDWFHLLTGPEGQRGTGGQVSYAQNIYVQSIQNDECFPTCGRPDATIKIEMPRSIYLCQNDHLLRFDPLRSLLFTSPAQYSDNLMHCTSGIHDIQSVRRNPWDPSIRPLRSWVTSQRQQPLLQLSSWHQVPRASSRCLYLGIFVAVSFSYQPPDAPTSELNA